MPPGPADTASLRHLLAPESVAVIGGGRRQGTVGRAILDNIRTGGYRGRLYAVNPHARYLGGVRCFPSVAGLPEAPDLAVIAVPPAAVVGIAEACGACGVKALVVITAGLDTGASADLLAICRRHGMRLAGPGCFGIAVPAGGLDATFAARHPQPGTAGLLMQSGGLGLALVDQLSRLGIGISSFASVGSKLDVSGDDMLLWWEQDGITRLAILYTESFGNPRKFARTARRAAATMPVLTVQARAASPPLASRQALFEQAGIIAAPGLGELTEVTALLATQPVPHGRTVAIVSNVDSAGVLTADACTGSGLAVHRPHGITRRRLHALVPDGGTVTGPVPAASMDALRDLLLRVSRLAEDLPEITELSLDPVIVRPTARSSRTPGSRPRPAHPGTRSCDARADQGGDCRTGAADARPTLRKMVRSHDRSHDISSGRYSVPARGGA